MVEQTDAGVTVIAFSTRRESPPVSTPSREAAIDDRELIREILSGRQEAPDHYEALVRRYEAKVRRLCVSMLSDPAEADDAAQEIFLKAYRSLNRFRGASAFSTWLYRIAANHCRDCLRARAREVTESWEALLEQQGDRIERLFSTPPDADTSGQADLVRRVLAQLSPDYRLLLLLREVEGLSYEELAETLQCSLDAVRGRLSRAREDFEQRFRHFLGTDTV
jgi:RNA polymerase sigma-70 factor (ECF subfamily)